MNNAYQTNTVTYDNQYRTGYSLEYPESHVIRVHRKILDYEVGLKGGEIFDYGCGAGGHLYYFNQNGFTPYGCDVSETAITKCRQRMPDFAKNFHVIPAVPKLNDYFSEDFDLIFSNQVLYYLNDADLQNILSQLYKMLKPGGIIFATMIGPGNYLARHIEEKTDGGLSKVVIRGRIDQTSYVNFKTREEVLQLFTSHNFKKLHLGFYTSIIREEEGPTDHYIFVGRKA